MTSDPHKIFFLPYHGLGITDDVKPEPISSAFNDWIGHSREILEKKREAAQKGVWMPTSEISEDHKELRPWGGQFCPALQEISNIGFILKWPQNAVLHREGDRAWKLVTHGEERPAYKYHGMTSFPEAGISDVLSIGIGWIVVTPPGWSALFKNIPNNLTQHKLGITIAEGSVRADQATIPLQVHAFIEPSAPDKITIERGKPMALLMPFQRAELEMVLMDDEDARQAAYKQADKDHQTFANAPRKYRELFINDYNPSPLYPKLVEMSAGKEGAAPVDEDPENVPDEQS